MTGTAVTRVSARQSYAPRKIHAEAATNTDPSVQKYSMYIKNWPLHTEQHTANMI